MWTLKHLIVAVIVVPCYCNFGLVEDIDDGRIWKFQVEIEAEGSHCFYQHIRPGEIVNADFDSTGPDGSSGIGIIINNEDSGEILMDIEGESGDFYDTSQTKAETGALFKFCLNNTLELESDSYKHVTVHFSTYLDGWGKYKEEIDRLDVQSSLFIMGIQRIQENVLNATALVLHSRAREARDYLLTESKNHYITFWSSLSLLGIIAAGLVQVYFIKSMFEKPGNDRVQAIVNKFSP